MGLTKEDMKWLEERFDRMDGRFDRMDGRFDRMEKALLVIAHSMPGSLPGKPSHVAQRVGEALAP